MKIHEELEYHGATVAYRRMPGNAKAFVTTNQDGYLIVVNDALGPIEQREAILHELQHIRRGDLFNPDYLEYAY